MPNIKRLIDNDGNEFYPRTVKAAISDLNVPDMTVTDVDPGAGQPLESGKIVAVVGNGGVINNSDIATGTITSDKLNKNSFLDLVYPVGSIYMSATLATATQVQNVLGGTWQAWGAGRVPVGVDSTQTEFNTTGKTGGEKTHTLTVSEIPSHNHILDVGVDNAPTGQFIPTSTSTKQWNYTHITNEPTNTRSSGGNGSHNNLPPYITCYMYKRTA